MKTWSWSNLERSWGGLGKLLGHFGRLLGRPGMLLGRLGELLGRPWGDPKSIQKSIRNLIRKQAESRRKKMTQTLRLSMFQSLTRLAGNWMRALEKAIKTAIDMISSYLSIYLLTPCLVALIIT